MVGRDTPARVATSESDIFRAPVRNSSREAASRDPIGQIAMIRAGSAQFGARHDGRRYSLPMSRSHAISSLSPSSKDIGR